MSDDHDNEIIVYLDEGPEPIARYRPPGSFDLDTTSMEDGPHVLRIVAVDRSGRRGARKISFDVRNGPGIAVDGLHENDVVEGKISVLINAYGGAYEDKWEPRRAETPKPVPTWAWVVLISVVAWAMYYGIQQWNPTPQFANTPTYRIVAQQKPEKPPAGLGAELYRTSCASCHQINGQGVPHLFPPMAGDPVVTASDPSEHIRIVLFGAKGSTIKGVSYTAQMPPWSEQLSDEEAAAVINHERTSWGNHAPAVTAEDVAKIRSGGGLSIAGKAVSATAGEEGFKAHCVTCHPDGGNIMNAEKTLHKKDLDANNIRTADDIVKIMRKPGPGMPPFDVNTIPDKDAKEMANYILTTFK